jgi:EAL domain-containing protein (putative c-di-GMP-specific phosphodiesterase class I)
LALGERAGLAQQTQIVGAATGPEYRLYEYLQRLSRNLEGRRAIQIHLSRLRPYNRKEHHVRIAFATFESMMANFEGQAFSLSNADIFYVGRGATHTDLDTAVMKVRHLFGEDPLTHGEDEEEIARFCTWYKVEDQFEEIIEMVQQMHKDAERRARLAKPGAGTERKSMDPKILAKLEGFLIKADLKRLMRRQPVAALAAGLKPQPVFNEIYISVADLQQGVMPNLDVMSDLWLFQYLTQTLDNRMLEMLASVDDAAASTSFSLNLNVATILGPSFVNFDSQLKAAARGTVVIELQQIDVFGDMSSYFFARDFLRERGYRICLDGLSYQSVQYIDREKLGLDLLKLHWTATMADDLSARHHSELKYWIDRAGRTRIILARCDSEEAVKFGTALGITMYQGQHIDRLIAKVAR